MLIGDVHGNTSGALKTFYDHPDVNVAIQLGDFGLLWKNGDLKSKYFDTIENQFPEKTIFVIPGNHENYDEIKKCPICDYNGCKVRKIRSNIMIVERGEVLSIDKRNFLCIGGADSIDKELRLAEMAISDFKRKIWWKEEAVTKDDITSAKANVDRLRLHGEKIDCILTHCAPEKVLKMMNFKIKNCGMSSVCLNEILDYVNHAENWYCGHYHISHKQILNLISIKKFQILGIEEIKII